MDTKVSVVMITYGHENYIKQAIKGVLNQKCNFNIELIVANDKSPDNTDQIINEIIANEPNSSIIKYINRSENIGMMPNLLDALKNANGDYIAICDGDDYWTDNYKLQKQIDALESNPEYSLCFHNAKVVYENSVKKPHLFNGVDQKQTLYFDDLIERWQIATASMVYKNMKLDYPDWFVTQYNGDMALQFMMIGHGPFLYLEDLMSVYRVHDHGISNRKNTAQIKNIESIIGLLNLIDDYYNKKYHLSIESYKIELNKMMRNVKIKSKYPFLQNFRMFIKNNLATVAKKI